MPGNWSKILGVLLFLLDKILLYLFFLILFSRMSVENICVESCVFKRQRGNVNSNVSSRFRCIKNSEIVTSLRIIIANGYSNPF